MRTAITSAALLLLAIGMGACGSGEPAADDRSAAARERPDPVVQVAAQAGRYVDAVNRRDLDALVESFAPGGKIVDVSREIGGRPAIRDWARAEVIGGRLEVLSVTRTAGGQDLLVHWAPRGGTGWRAHYRFTFQGDRIALADLQYA
ncbi:nuclear transport factor 2 family protein [Actinomadura welshii]|uniref:nuclear transport factor 2 family protein n=1 Tax=Actinomadura welshii TaxID=3103817 RepID=UPI001378F769|nr:nuclear transport factor 2 family protein [Actinomadura madurae]